MLRRLYTPAALGAAALLAAAGAARGAVIEREYTFAFPEAESCAAAADGCAPWAEDSAVLRKELHPVVPVRVARLLLPPGEMVVTVEVTDLDVRHAAFAPAMAGLQTPMEPAPFRHRDPPAYGGGVYPADWHGTPVVQRFRGYAIAQIPLYPWRMAGGRDAMYVERATLRVTTRPVYEPEAERPRAQARDLDDLAARVDNPPRAALGRVHIVRPEDEVGYLIIGPRALIGTPGDSPLAPLIQDKEDRQLTVRLAALEDVAPHKTPKEIRDYIRERYRADGIDFVLLVGDKGNLPWKYVSSGMSDRSDPVPSDQYYACLDGEFDRPSAIDWACEVSVGRVGARTRDDVGNWVAKTLALQKAARDRRIGNALSFGEKLDDRTLGQRTLDFLVDGRAARPKTTGFPGNVRVTKLYETFRRSISGREFIEALNGGDFHVVNHLGHANETYVFRTDAGDLSAFRSRPAFFYSEGCYPNDPDADNWTIRAVRMKDYGPAAMIANTRYGWYEAGDDGEGSSSVLHRTFWSMRFANGVKSIGAMNHKAKEAVVAVDDSDVMRYTALESSLIGDPELDLGL